MTTIKDTLRSFAAEVVALSEHHDINDEHTLGEKIEMLIEEYLGGGI